VLTVFAQMMIPHHQQAVEMVDLLKGTKNSEAKKLAKGITRIQKAEITAMKKLLVKLA
jgi:uncharacterized protein (DUF305 family)